MREPLFQFFCQPAVSELDSLQLGGGLDVECEGVRDSRMCSETADVAGFLRSHWKGGWGTQEGTLATGQNVVSSGVQIERFWTL